MNKSVYDLALNESIQYSAGEMSTLDLEITRVPGGWIYNYKHLLLRKSDILDVMKTLGLSSMVTSALNALKFDLPGIWQSNPVFVPYNEDMKDKQPFIPASVNNAQAADPGEPEITTGNSPVKKQ